MKADDNLPVQKFGMPIEQAEPYAACQKGIAEDQVLIADLHLRHALQEGPRLRAALDSIGAADPAPVAAPVPAVPAIQHPTAPAPEPTRSPVPDVPFGLRASLGLG